MKRDWEGTMGHFWLLGRTPGERREEEEEEELRKKLQQERNACCGSSQAPREPERGEGKEEYGASLRLDERSRCREPEREEGKGLSGPLSMDGGSPRNQ